MDNLNIRKALMIGSIGRPLPSRYSRTARCPPTASSPRLSTPGPGDQTFREANGDLVPKDVSSARQYWEKGVEELGGEEPELTLLHNDKSLARDIATYLQDQYKKNLGVTFDVQIVTFDAALEKVPNEDYQISFVYGWIGDYNDPMTFMDLYLSDSPNNNSNFKNEEYDRLIREAQTTSDLDLRMQNMLKAERILIEQAATVPIYYQSFAGVQKPYFKNYAYHSFGGTDWKYARIEGE